MTGKVRKVSRERQAVKENQEKNLNHVKQKASAVKPRVKKVAQNPPDQHEKIAKKKRCKTVRPKKVVHNPLDRIRQLESQKGSSQPYVHHFTSCLKERNVASRQNSLRTATSHTNSQVTPREPAQNFPKKTGSPALERTKKLDAADKARLLRRQHASITPKKGRNVVPLQLTLRNITVPLPFTYNENQPTHRTVSRAQALVEMAQQSRLNTPHSQGLSALAPDLPPRRTKSSEMTFTGKNCVIGYHVNVPAGEVEPNCWIKQDATWVMVPELTEAAEPRPIKPKQVSLYEDWRPGSGRPQKLLRPLSVDGGRWQQQEIERQQDRRFAQKIAMRKKELRSFRRLEGVGRDIDAVNTTSTPARDTQSIANFPIREDVEKSARGYAKFLYRPGAAWRNEGSDCASFSSFGPNLHMLSEQFESTRPASCATKKSTAEIVGILSLANARREAMRKELVERLRDERARKRLFLAQERAAARRQLLQCRCPGKCCY